MKKTIILGALYSIQLISADQSSWWQRLFYGRQAAPRYLHGYRAQAERTTSLSATQELAHQLETLNALYFVPQANVAQPNTIWSNNLLSGVRTFLETDPSVEIIKVDNERQLEFAEDASHLTIRLRKHGERVPTSAIYDKATHTWRFELI